MCALIYLLYERLRGEILKKRKKKKKENRNRDKQDRRKTTSEEIKVFVFLIVWGWDWDEIFYIFLNKKIPQPHTCFHVTLTCILVEYLLQFQTLIYIYIYIFNEINATFWRPLNVYKYNTCNVINSFNSVLHHRACWPKWYIVILVILSSGVLAPP